MNHVWHGLNPRMWKCLILDGADSATSIAASGLVKDDDEIVYCFVQDGTSGLFTDELKDECSITADSYIENSTTDTTGDKLILLWIDQSAGDET